MRLLRTSTFKLESFYGDSIPPYAVLSHTWGDEEVSFEELQEISTQSTLLFVKRRGLHGKSLEWGRGKVPKKGIFKIVGCALQAEKDGFEYIWCDTCCIDQRNHTELSESINSMYTWYQVSTCYAYLSDLLRDGSTRPALAESRWFTRGWTLQELIVPATVQFFDGDWQLIGTRSQFKDVIANKTGIRVEVLDGKSPTECSVAERMSWAAHRETTRVEDKAYCLMGLFQVNMPLIYGEKDKAFFRLQTEIMRQSEDHSLFAWASPSVFGEGYCGLLAPSPAYFAGSRNVRDAHHNMREPPFTMTSRGISIYLPLYKIRYVSRSIGEEKAGMFFAPLACSLWNPGCVPEHLGIYLVQNRDGTYSRCYPHLLVDGYEPDAENFFHKVIYVVQNDTLRQPRNDALYRIRVPELPAELQEQGVILRLFLNKQIATWDRQQRLLICPQGLGASLYIGSQTGKGLVMHIGIDPCGECRCAFDDGSDAGKKSFAEFGPEPKDALNLAPALLLYRSDKHWKPGPYEEEFFGLDLLRSESPTSEFKRQKSKESQRLFIDRVKRERRRHWDDWISRPRNNTASLHFETRTRIERPRSMFFQKKVKEVYENAQRTLFTSVKDVHQGGVKTFLVILGI